MMEKAIQSAILDYLKYAKEVGWAMRVNAGKIKVNSKYGSRFINMAPAGTSDIIGMLKGGKFFAIEVKTPDRIKTLTTYQKNFIDKINENGGIAFMATSVDDVINNFKKLWK